MAKVHDATWSLLFHFPRWLNVVHLAFRDHQALPLIQKLSGVRKEYIKRGADFTNNSNASIVNDRSIPCWIEILGHSLIM